MAVNSDVKDKKLAGEGKKKIEWAGAQMPVMMNLIEGFKKDKPFKGYKIGCCLHVTSETANLMIALKEGGAEVSLCASNPLSTQDMVASSLVEDHGIEVYAIHGEDKDTYYKHIMQVIDNKPQITMDDGADLVNELHKIIKTNKSEMVNGVMQMEKDWEFLGSSEETTTGVIRLKAMYKDNALFIPVIAVNDSQTKHMFDNRYGTGQSTIDGVIRATNILLAGKKVVVCGYGWCGRGIASRARGMGALVTVTEVDPIKALEASMDGFEVNTISNAVKYGELFITATGDKNVIPLDLIKVMNEGAIICNSGHFNVEFDYDGLVAISTSRRVLRHTLEELVIEGGKKVYVLGEGRLVNLASADGHPAEVMDMSFANQALAAKHLIDNKGKLGAQVYTLPQELDEEVARIKLRAMGISIDTLTVEQQEYLNSWQEGT
ncbi:MAG: adenosylhomocysteinase [bacterium]|nr:adenosylhomocysteinase [bacterium]